MEQKPLDDKTEYVNILKPIAQPSKTKCLQDAFCRNLNVLEELKQTTSMKRLVGRIPRSDSNI